MSTRTSRERSLSVLLADDHSASRRAARRILERAGHQVTEATTGFEVVERAGREIFDLVLMDVGMPGLDGPTAAQRIRSLLPPAGRVPIVGMSGYADEEARERCLGAGMNAFLAKPYRVRELLTALSTALGVASDESSVGDEVEWSPGFSRSEFVASTREDLRQLAEAVSSGQREEVRRLAHGLAGAAAMWGIDDMQELAREVHAAAGDAPLEEVARLVALLQDVALR